jgi:hypothetical protein
MNLLETEMKAIAIAILAVFMTGCATDMSRYYAVQEKALEADKAAVMALAAAAASGNQGAIVALALRQGQSGKIAPPQDKALQWASVLAPTLTNIYGINRNTRISLANINAETERYDATLGAIEGIAGQGFEAATQPPYIVGPEMGFRLLSPN